MNTEEVCAMIDAITEGNAYEMEVPVSSDSVDGLFVSLGECVIFRPDSNVTSSTIDSPRTAREIAGALVAWANRKEGVASASEMIEILKPFTAAKVKREGVWREEWYTRNVKRMTPETIKRNLQDEQGIYNTLHPNSEEAVDTQKAINILQNALKGIMPPENPNV